MMSRSRAAAICLMVLLFASTAFASSATADEPAAPQPELRKHNLQYKFIPGEDIRYDVSHVASIETTIAGTTQTADTSSKSVKLWRVGDSDGTANAIIEHSVESVDMKHTISGRKQVTYNSIEDAVPPPGYEDAAKAVGVPLAVVTVNSRGHLLHRSQKLIQPASNALNTQIMYPLPAEPVTVGHVWTLPHDVDVALEGGMTKKIQTRQRLELVSVSPDNIAQISIETQVLTPLHNPKIEAQLIQRLAKGTIDFDITAGRITKQELKCDERVLGFSGPESSMHYLSRFTERLRPAESATVKATTPAPRSVETRPRKPELATRKPSPTATKKAPAKKRR